MQAAATPSVSPRAAYAQRGITTLQHIFRDHFGHFAADYDSRYAKDLGNFRIERITRVATRFLTCGDYPLSGSGVYSRRESCQGVAPHPARCSPGVAPVPHGASACAARPHGAHHGAARRLPLSLGEADREGV